MKQHLKRLAVPKTWPLAKKGNKYVTRPMPKGSIEFSLPLTVIFRDVLKMVKTAKEVKHLLANNYVFINGVQIKDVKQSIALMDVLEMKGTNEAYRLLLNSKGKLVFVKIDDKEAKLRPSRIKGKTLLKKGKVQLNMASGANLLVDKDEYKVGDVLFLQLPENKIKEKLSLDKGVFIYLIGGNHMGKNGKVVDIIDHEIIFKYGKEEFKTAKRYAFAVGKDKSQITLAE